MTLVQFLTSIIHLFYSAGAHHVYGTKEGGNGLVSTKHWLVVACKIPAGAHGVFHCSGWVRR